MKTITKLFTYFLILTAVFLFQKNSIALIYPINHTLTGSQENPPNGSPASGTIVGTFNDVSKDLTFVLNFSGLVAGTTAAHFHAAAGPTQNAPVRIGFVGFPSGVTSGTYSNTYSLTPQQEAWLLTDSMYVNVHTSQFPGGEIRAQIIPDAPLPVELASFTSVINRNNVTLQWRTVIENNNSGFEIERSVIKGEWAKVGSLTGYGNSSIPRDYSFTDKGLNMGIYNYRLKQIDYNGNFEYFGLSNEVNIGIPAGYNLSQNYPNPFNPGTKIDFDLPNDGIVSIKLYDLSGKEISTLLNEFRSAGYYSIRFNSGSVSGGLSSGMYFYRIKTGNFEMTKKMMLIKWFGIWDLGIK